MKKLIEIAEKAHAILEDLNNTGAVDFSEDDIEVIMDLEQAIINAKYPDSF